MDKYSIALFILSLILANGISITLDGSWNGAITSDGIGTRRKPRNEISFSATVPGGIYTDLMKANIIPDNLAGNNDINNRWVGNQSVSYSKNFNVDEEIFGVRRVLLVFHGIDTFSTIYLNNQEIGKTSNMFVRYTYDVKPYLKLGDNALKVVINSPVRTAANLFKEQSQRYVVLPLCVPKDYNGECHVNHIRKMQASFSWDWGPAFPSMGIWKSVELIPIRDIEIMEVSTGIESLDDFWRVEAEILIEPAMETQEEVNASLVLQINDTPVIGPISSQTVSTSDKVIIVALDVPKERVNLWWPNGYGEQTLYTLTAVVKTSSYTLEKSVRVGFRTIKLVEEPLREGRSFYFEVNGVPIFAKGSNYIPASIFPELGADKDTIKHLLLSSKETHMNMLRVWGGGVYESELFYDLADEYGIMIWQDFMFACGMYPTTEEFLESVKKEVVQNIRRLKNHPSIVLWAGNNENEAALFGNWYGTGSDKIYRDDYVKLYVDLIKKEVIKSDITRPFVVSSPSNGMYTAEYNYTGKNPYSNLYGDVHYYNYLRNSWDINQYPRARFSSEYGFQSLPSIYTMTSAIETRADLSENSEFLKHRQHLPFGKVFMHNLVLRNLEIPSSNNSLQDFADFIYLSQINQAVSQRIQTEFYRQSKSDLNSAAEGMTMGALYWQLNDVWQAPSWSSIDFSGRWKMLHYYAAEFFAPIIVTSHLSQANDLSIFVVSDKLNTIPNCQLDVSVYRWDSIVPVYVKHIENIVVEANKAKLVNVFWLDEFLKNSHCGSLLKVKEQCIVTLTLKDEAGTQIAPNNYVYPTRLKLANFPQANIAMKVEEQVPGKFANYPDIFIELTTDKIALFIWLEVGNIRGRFSENGFHMFENKKRIVFHAQEFTTPEILRENLRLVTLSDLYNPNRKDVLEATISL